MRRALAMSWVIATAVLPSRFTQSTISPSMIAPMIGSSPVVGSSKNSMSGCDAIARASPTRFCIPAGQFRRRQVADAGGEADLREDLDRARFRVDARNLLPRQQSERHVLPHGQTVEQRAVLEQHADARARRLPFAAGRARTLAPSISMLPPSGSIRPRMHFRSTDLPEPEPPITTIEVLGQDVEVDTVQHELLAEAFAQVAEADLRWWSRYFKVPHREHRGPQRATETRRADRQCTDRTCHWAGNCRTQATRSRAALELVAIEECLCFELAEAKLEFRRQVSVPVVYRGKFLEAGFRADIVVAHELILEIKSVEALGPMHEAQLLTYLRMSAYRIGF